jgi:hypothetical protein
MKTTTKKALKTVTKRIAVVQFEITNLRKAGLSFDDEPLRTRMAEMAELCTQAQAFYA